MTFEEHAAECYPRECCGLMVDGEYVPCRNTTTEPDMINVHPEDWANAEDRGEIQAVCHSHPNATNYPSALDLQMMERTRLPWWIMSWPGGAIRKLAPVSDLLGRQFQYGVHDCCALAREYYLRVWGLELPEFDRGRYGWWNEGQDLFTEGLRKTDFYDIAMSELRVGDCILMQIHSPVPNHVAVMIEDNIILHHLDKRLSTRDIYGGFFRKVSVRFMRHDKCSPK